MATQPARSAVHRSIHPNLPGVPWWAAVVIAVTATAVGFAVDAESGNKELNTVFAVLYVAGCVAAVLAVRQSGLFTAVIQPPLILFCAVPGGYWLFHGAKFTGVKDILINCGYPLIERFPLMVFTSAGVLLIGLARWSTTGRKPGIASQLAAILRRASADQGVTPDSPQVRATRHRRKSTTPADRDKPPKRPAPTRSRHGAEPPPQLPRRPRPSPASGWYPQREPDPYVQPPREIRRDPYARRSSYDRPTTRNGRFDPYQPMEHHPISRVRYRSTGNERT